MKKNSILSDFLQENRQLDIQCYINKNLDITEQIYAYLKEKGWSQTDLAKKLGKSNAEISKWLSGTHNLTLKSITKLETIFNEDIILTPQKAEKKYKEVKYIRVPVKAKANNLNIKTSFSNSKNTQKSEVLIGKYNFAMAT